MKILQSSWMCALVGAVLYLGATVAVWKPPVIERPATVVAGFIGSSLGASWNFHNPEVDELIADVKKQRDQLDARERELNDLAARLQLERQEITVVTQTVARLQQEFDANVVRVRQEETANLKKLAKIYAAMPPESATAILKELQDDEIVKIFAFMKESETAAILELLSKPGASDAKRAAQISERLRLCLSRPANEKPKT